jgi:O-acetyl-ADP-ribose deacetylase (regulator of RNase III)
MADKKKDRKLSKAIDRLLSDEASFTSDYIKDNGIDPKEIGRKGSVLAKQLLEINKRRLFFKKEDRQITWTHPSVLKLLSENTNKIKDPIQLIKNKSRALVLEAFTRGWAGPPFDIIQLAKLSNIDVVPFELVPDARIIPMKSNDFRIEYNPFQSPARRNFSIAHEIGHTLFSDCGEMIRNREEKLEDESWQLEFLCNVAASELLLPYAEFSIEANEIQMNVNGLIDLARKYNASVESVFLRFCEVVEKPCTIAITSITEKGDLKVMYSKSSAVSDLTISRGYTIPRGSKAYDCTKSGWTAHALELWEIFNGIRYRVFGVGLSPIRKQTTSRVGVFLVPESYDNYPSRGIYWVYGDATAPRGEGKKIIGQVVNTSGAMGFGFGRAIAIRYPKAKRNVQEWKKQKREFALGNSRLVQVDNDVYVFQMLAQEGIKAKFGNVPLKYSSLQNCLKNLYDEAIEMNASVHLPAIGAGQAKGDWNIIKGMIHDELVKKGIDVTIYMRQGTNMKPNESRTLIIYKEDAK